MSVTESIQRIGLRTSWPRAARLALCSLGFLFALRPALEACPSNAAADTQRGITLYASEDYTGAEKLFEKLAEACPRDAALQVWLGRAAGRHAERASWFSAMGLAKKTRRAFEQAVEIDPKFPDALSALIDFYVSAPGIVGGGVSKAVPLAERLQTVAPADGHRAWAQIHRARGEWAEAEESIRSAIAAEPDEPGHVLALGSLFARQGRNADSDRAYEKAFQMAPEDPAVWYSRADALIRTERDPAEARRLLERYLKAKLDPLAEPPSAAKKLLEKL